MKKYFITICTLILFSVPIDAQWYKQQSNTIQQLYAVLFVDQNNGWAVGDEGTILQTTDGGNNWVQQTSGTTNFFTGIFFISPTEGWAVGGHYSPKVGIIYHTTNSGENWDIQIDTLPNFLTDVFFISNTTGWTVGISGQIYRTSNGGTTWVYSGVDDKELRAVCFVDSNIGCAVGGSPYNTESKLLKTTDGGLNWITKTVPTNNYLRAVFFISEEIGWVGGNDGALFKTTDGGDSWEPKDITSEGIYSIFFINSNLGWLSCSNGLIFNTSNGGEHWNQQETQVDNYINSIIFTDENTGWAVGSIGTILHTSNGGLTFIDNENTEKLSFEFSLSQNYPNPFNPSTTISWQSPVSSWQTIKLFNSLGQEVETIVDDYLDAGTHSKLYIVNSALPSGVYFYQLKAVDPSKSSGQVFIQTHKMIILK